MNKKVTLMSLAERLAETCNIPVPEAESRIKNYFDIIAETIASGDNVKVKGLGTFKAVGIEPRESVDVTTGKRMVIPGHRRAVFTPEKWLAEKVNAPFAAFEAVELSDDLTEEELEVAAMTEDPAVADAATFDAPVREDSLSDETSEAEPAATPTEEPEEVTADTEVTEEPEVTAEPEEPSEPAVEEEAVSVALPSDIERNEVDLSEKTTDISDDGDDDDIDDDVPERKPRHSGHFLTGFLIGIACMFLVLGGLWCWYRFAPDSFDNILGRPESREVAQASVVASLPASETTAPKSEPAVAQADVNAEEAAASVASSEDEAAEKSAEVPTEPSDDSKATVAEPEYDTITKTRFLTTMARDHYGSYHLWPYIYMENSKILGHPDRIKPGTRVVIPPAEKYGINAKDKACIAKAKKLGVEIYARYK